MTTTKAPKTKTTVTSRRFLGVLLLGFTACATSNDVGAGADAGATDASATDASATDARATDATATDASAADATATDASATDARVADAAATDARAADATATDGGPPGPVDGVIAAMPPGSWKELPSTHMADVCPPPYEHYGCSAVMSAWSGAAYDGNHDQLFVFGGGHSDSYYNNVFVFDLATTTWRRATELPAGLTGDDTLPVPAAVYDKRVEPCGLYPSNIPSGTPLNIPAAWLGATGYLMADKCDDPSIVAQLDAQQPRSRHTYGNLAFSEATNRFYALGGVVLYPSGQSLTMRVEGFDPVTNGWTRYADNTFVSYGTSATDGSGNIWYLSTTGKLAKYDAATDQWQAQASDAMGGYYGGAAVDTSRNVLVVTADGKTLYAYALAQAGAPLTTRMASSPVALAGAPGFEYSPALDRFVAWSGGSAVSMLDPVAWTWKAAPATGDVPTAASSQGTFGRFRYSRRRNVFVAVNATTEDVFLYKPPPTAP